jgi:elongation factor 2
MVNFTVDELRNIMDNSE